MTHKERAKRRQQLVTAVKAGVSLGEVAIMYDVEIATVRNACKAAGIFVAGTQIRTIELIAALLNTNGTLCYVAESLSLDYGSVARIYRRCLAAGIKLKLRKRGRPKRCLLQP